MDNMDRVESDFFAIGGRHGGGGRRHRGGGRRGGRGYPYPVYGGYYGYPYQYPYYWDYPQQEIVVVKDDGTTPTAKDETDGETQKEATSTEKVSAKSSSTPIIATPSMNYIIGGAAGAVAGYFVAQSRGDNAIVGAAIGAVGIIGAMMAINQFTKK